MFNHVQVPNGYDDFLKSNPASAAWLVRFMIWQQQNPSAAPSQDELATIMGVRVATLRRHMKDCLDAGLMTREKIAGQHTGSRWEYFVNHK